MKNKYNISFSVLISVYVEWNAYDCMNFCTEKQLKLCATSEVRLKRNSEMRSNIAISAEYRGRIYAARISAWCNGFWCPDYVFCYKLKTITEEGGNGTEHWK